MKTPLTMDRLKQHLTYSWWKYLLMAVLVVFSINILFTVTAYRPPEDKRLTVYIYASGFSEPLDEWLQATLASDFPDQELFDIILTTPDDSYGEMALSTHMAVGEGDIIILPRETYQRYADAGFLVPLDGEETLMSLCAEKNIDFDRSYRRNEETGERHIYGIPADGMPMIQESFFGGDYYFIGIRVNNGNDENSLKLLRLMVERLSL